MEQQPISPKSAANFRMIDISAKTETHRIARASGYFYAKQETIALIKERRLPKGDVLILCEVAGIQAAKRTIDLLPLCHPLDLSSVRVWTEFMGDDQLKVTCEAQTVGKTGVEMEALCGVTAALLCIYDLAKGVDPVLRIGDVQLEHKEGGKSGVWMNPSLQPTRMSATTIPRSEANKNNLWAELRACILTISDRAARGEYDDRSGPVARQWLVEKEAAVVSTAIVADDGAAIEAQLLKWIERESDSGCGNGRESDYWIGSGRESAIESGSPRPEIIVTTGGTGLSPRDQTPEALIAFAAKHGGRVIPGIGERLRHYGSQFTKNAWLSRSVAIQVGQTFIVCLPGSPKAVREGLDAIESLVPHALKMMRGGDHEKP